MAIATEPFRSAGDVTRLDGELYDDPADPRRSCMNQRRLGTR